MERKHIPPDALSSPNGMREIPSKKKDDLSLRPQDNYEQPVVRRIIQPRIYHNPFNNDKSEVEIGRENK